MTRIKRSRITRVVASAIGVCLLGEVLLPATAFALTGGPQQPEFSGFEPVGSTGMVNEFTGAFSYNLPVLSVPGPNGFGYAISLGYHSNPSPEEEASWVGYGWNLSPGTITRSKRGFPDDRKSADVEYWNKTRNNVTLSATKRLGIEAWSVEQFKGKDRKGQTLGGLSGFITNRYNNHRGYGYATGFSLQMLGAANIGYSQSDGQGAWSFSISPVALLSALTSLGSGAKPAASEWSQVPGKILRRAVEGTVAKAHTISSATGAYGIWSFSDYSIPTNSPTYSGTMLTFGAALEVAVLPNIGPEAGLSGTYSIQTSSPVVSRPTVGYMYSGSANLDDKSAQIMDYRMERDGAYHSRDEFLSLPFALADQYAVSGEGIGGGFRVHHRRPGYFRPNYAESNTGFAAANLDIQIGVDVGWGGEISGGAQKFTVSGGGNGDVSFAKGASDDEPYFFRFTDDLGGNVLQSTSDEPQSGYFTSDDVSFAPGASGNAGRVGRSGFIGYSTNAELNEHPRQGCWGAVNEGIESRAFNRSKVQDQTDSNANLRLFVDRTDPGIADGIGEFAITKEDGSTYLYGLPVYSRNERNLSIGLFGSNDVENNFIAYRAAPGANDDHTLVGQVDKTPYATAYLLTGIVGPDYVDRTNDGLTDDDLGGFVRFNYTRVAGSTSKTSGEGWYKWRMPYQGLQYQRNSLSDPMDDVGVVQYGEKEIYYLKSIETKTHVALFTTTGRDDAYPAVADESIASTSHTAKTVGTAVPRVQKLTRIDLHKKSADNEKRVLVSTTRFEYDSVSALCKNLPNAAAETGRLTLKRVWFEYEGAVSATINPYVFGYQYDRTAEYTTKLGTEVVQNPVYAPIVSSNDSLNRDSENPSYQFANIDQWGSYQFEGILRHGVFNPWVDQTPGRVEADEQLFDPAAWHLKTIKLPSGGEIHVQYEQNRYTHVQHRPAMVMARLGPRPLQSMSDDPLTRNRYFLDLNDVGITHADTVAELLEDLRYRFVDPNGPREFMYFRFLYVLEGRTVPQASMDTLLSRCNTEYITGYAPVTAVDQDPSDGRIYVTFDVDDGTPLPERVCDDYARTHGSGIRNLGGSCNATVSGVPDTRMNVGETIEMLLKLYLGVLSTHNSALGCKWMSQQNSYLRIPTPQPKLGGGVRVKRILMVDPGLETGEAALYGTEYSYVTEDGSCSGVATNEPTTGREENSLVGLLKKRTPGTSEVFSGEDKDQFEGPIGETLLPGPSIGYARVVARNIHSGPTGTGAVVSRFYTARDYPFDLANATAEGVNKLGTKKTGIRGPDKITMGFNAGVVSGDFSKLWKTQGFRFVVSNMHGQPRSTSTHADWVDGSSRNLGAEIASVTYEYFQPGELVPISYGPSIEDTVHGNLGKEIEVVTESRRIRDFTVDANGQVDFGVMFLLFPLPFGSANVSGSVNQTVMRQHVATKVIRYPVIQKKVTVKKDGIESSTEHVAFDPTSGKPSLVRTTDGHHGLALLTPVHDGSYYSLSIPASRHYPVMGQKASNYRAHFGGDGSGSAIAKRYADGRHWLSIDGIGPNGMQRVLNGLSSGDVILVSEGVISLGTYHVGSTSGNRIEIVPTSFSYSETKFVAPNVTVTILSSGKTNQLTSNVGSVTTYGAAPSFQP